VKYEEINFELYKKAINSYIKLAYPNGVKEYNFCYKNIKKFNEATNLKEIQVLLEENRIKIEENFEIRKYTLRLGSEKYPFLKLVLQEAEVAGDFGFLVDRHTEYLALVSSSNTFEEEKRIKEYTKKLKDMIEKDFEDLGVPTYHSIIKQFIVRLKNMKSTISIRNNGIKVLLVDDDEDILTLDKLSLEILGYSVSVAKNGEEALLKVDNEKNDILLLDMLMPTISGFEVINRVTNKIPIIVLSSLTDDMSKRICLEGGAKAILTKPVESYILDECIKRVLKGINIK
jgi:CheY-like chemotaxis protein